jgi:hypothetical protein
LDISTIKSDKAEMDLLHPATDDPIGITFTLLPMDDPDVKKAARSIQNKLQNKKKQHFTASETEANGMELMYIIITDIKWKKDVDWNGEKLTAKKSDLKKMLAPAKSSWIRKQLEEYIGETENFYQN